MSRSAGRDYRIDFVRGLALIMIFINHIPDNGVAYLTNRNFGFSDAAEIFVLLAGFAAAAAFYSRFVGGYPVATSVRIARRAGFLYTAHILTTMLAFALICAAATLLQDPAQLQKLDVTTFVNNPVAGLLGVTLLTHQLSYFNILPLYILLLLFLPLLMAIYRIDWRIALGASVAVWLLAGFIGIIPPSYPAKTTWFFNPFAWQLLFVIGFIWGVRVRAGLTIPYSRTLFWAAIAYLVLSLIWVKVPLWDFFPRSNAVGYLWSFNKTYLSPFRLAHVLALAYVVAYSPLGQWLRAVSPTNPIVQMGQHALPVFCVASLLSTSIWLVRDATGGALIFDIVSVATGIAIQFMLARFLVWQSKTPAGQVGSQAAGGFVAAPPSVIPPPAPVLSASMATPTTAPPSSRTVKRVA